MGGHETLVRWFCGLWFHCEGRANQFIGIRLAQHSGIACSPFDVQFAQKPFVPKAMIAVSSSIQQHKPLLFQKGTQDDCTDKACKRTCSAVLINSVLARSTFVGHGRASMGAV